MGCKIFLFFGVLIIFGILLIGSVCAGSCSDQNQVIMRLYQDTNSHGALWNDTHDTDDVCFDQIFTFSFNGVPDRNCHADGKNRIINLYQTYNSHAEILGAGNNYQNGVCYDDLECRSITSGSCDDSKGEKPVISLFKNTNSHIAKGNFYTNIICCIAFKVNNVNWTDMTDKPINTSDLNDRVKLMVTGFGFINKSFIFTVYKKSDGSQYGDVQTKIASDLHSVYVTIKIFVPGEYYYNVTDFLGRSYSSGKLTVSNIEQNSAPVANITNPKKGEIYFKGENVNFTQSSYDVDDYMNYSWNFDDLTIVKGWTFDYINYNTTHIYGITGEKNINLSVIDERGLTDQDLVSILIIDPNATVGTKYVFAGIRKPKYKDIITTIGDVEFDASDSYALEVTSASPSFSIKCLGGACPVSITGVTNYVITNPGIFSMFNFSWRFDDGGESGLISGNPKYRRPFAIGDHNAKLEVSINPVDKGNTIVIFKYNGGSSDKCQNGNTIWVENGIGFNTLENNSKCLGPDGVSGINASGINDDCCPPLYTCQVEGLAHKCKISASCLSIPSCSNYSDQTSCNNDKYNCSIAAKGCSSSSTANICGNSVGGITGGSCNCFWDSSSGTCKLNKTIGFNIAGIYINGICVIGSIIQGECTEGQKVVTQNSTVIWGYDSTLFSSYLNSIGAIPSNPEDWLNKNCQMNDCFSGTRIMACDDNVIRLSFFNWINALIAVIIIVIIYIVWYSYKKNKKVKKIRK